jgi:S-disulfanyl-L-cysteine oxidoreductase SoxD
MKGRKVQNTPVTSNCDRRLQGFVSFVAIVFAAFVAFVVSVTFVAGVAAQAPATVWDGVYTEEQANRGNPTYQRFCAACHGDQLLGAESAPPLVGDAFNSNWDGVTLGDLVNRIRTTMPQDNPGALSRAQTADVIAFILQSGKFPAGSTALDPQAMSGVMFRSMRP